MMLLMINVVHQCEWWLQSQDWFPNREIRDWVN